MQENDAWDIWINIYPYMVTGHIEPMKFNEFKDELFVKPRQFTNISDDEIEDEIMAVVAAYERR